MRLVAVGLALSLITGARAENQAAPKCTKAAAIEAEQEADSLSDWHHIFRSFRRFSQCDDGAIAEVYSESITKLLSDDWKSLNQLVVLTNQSRSFKRFVLKHIDDTVPSDTLAKIAQNARSECTATGQNLGRSIAKAAEKR
jgi:hypothetical protein